MIVLDCCAAVDIVRDTDDGRALNSLMRNDEEIISSELLYVELASAFEKYVKAGLIFPKQALVYIEKAICLVDRFIPLEENYVEAFHETTRLMHPVYDMVYLTLARRNAATLFSLDKKLIRLCEQLGIDCVHVLAGLD